MQIVDRLDTNNHAALVVVVVAAATEGVHMAGLLRPTVGLSIGATLGLSHNSGAPCAFSRCS